MDNGEEVGPLARLVRRVQERTAQGQPVSIGLLQEVAGVRAAGPMLLLPALIVVSPLSNSARPANDHRPAHHHGGRPGGSGAHSDLAAGLVNPTFAVSQAR